MLKHFVSSGDVADDWSPSSLFRCSSALWILMVPGKTVPSRFLNHTLSSEPLGCINRSDLPPESPDRIFSTLSREEKTTSSTNDFCVRASMGNSKSAHMDSFTSRMKALLSIVQQEIGIRS